MKKSSLFAMSLIVMLLEAPFSEAMNFGQVAGAASQAYEKQQTDQAQQNAENAEAAAVAAEEQSIRQGNRLLSGSPQLSRMQVLESRSDQIYLQVSNGLPPTKGTD
jgi:hypothetical protein